MRPEGQEWGGIEEPPTCPKPSVATGPGPHPVKESSCLLMRRTQDGDSGPVPLPCSLPSADLRFAEQKRRTTADFMPGGGQPGPLRPPGRGCCLDGGSSQARL